MGQAASDSSKKSQGFLQIHPYKQAPSGRRGPAGASGSGYIEPAGCTGPTGYNGRLGSKQQRCNGCPDRQPSKQQRCNGCRREFYSQDWSSIRNENIAAGPSYTVGGRKYTFPNLETVGPNDEYIEAQGLSSSAKNENITAKAADPPSYGALDCEKNKNFNFEENLPPPPYCD